MTVALLEKQPSPAKRRCLILANPKAGSILGLRQRIMGYARRYWNQARSSRAVAPLDEKSECISLLSRCCSEADVDACVEAVPSEAGLPARIRSAEQEGFDVIVAAGGDGTIHSISQAMIGSPLIMGILPMGTANNIARSLGLPIHLPDALRVLSEGNVHPIDIGQVAGRYFLEAAGVGLFADAFAAFGKEEPRKWQVLRLLRVLGPLFWNPAVRKLRLTLDGAEEKDESIWVAISNTRFIGDNIELAPGAVLEDGHFDVIIVGALNRQELLQFIIALHRGKHLTLPKVRRLKARTVEIQGINRALPVHCDAEIVTNTPTRFETIPRGIRVLTPSPSPCSQ